MNSTKILLASHIYSTDSGPVYGPYNVIKDYLENKGVRVRTIEYPLASGSSLIFKSLAEIFKTIKIAANYKPDVFIGVDPLNALAGVLLKKIKLVKKTIFYCVDYTPTRFGSSILNNAYLTIDKLVSKKSDEVWNVSSRILEVRKSQGISENKIRLVPNSPDFNSCPRIPKGKIDRNKIVMVAGLTHSPAFDLVLPAFKDLSKKFPKVRLSVIGTGPYQKQLAAKVRKMGLSKKIKFMGQLPTSDLLKEVSKSGMALAIYTYSKKYSWVYYGDSKKAREYLACGVPVVITDVVGTANDIKDYSAGIVIEPNINDLYSAMFKIVDDKKLWSDYQTNAIKLAREMDISKILDKIFKSLL